MNKYVEDLLPLIGFKYVKINVEIDCWLFSCRIRVFWTSDSDSSSKTEDIASWKRLETPKLVNKSLNLVLEKCLCKPDQGVNCVKNAAEAGKHVKA